MTVGRYTLQCQEVGCGWKKIVENSLGAGWGLGMVIPSDPSDPNRTTCALCKHSNMAVVTAPEVNRSLPPKGFSKVPTK